MSATVTYKGVTLTTVNNETKVLNTQRTWLEDNITITDKTDLSNYIEKYIYQDENGFIHWSDTIPTSDNILKVFIENFINIVNDNKDILVNFNGDEIISMEG